MPHKTNINYGRIRDRSIQLQPSSSQTKVTTTHSSPLFNPQLMPHKINIKYGRRMKNTFQTTPNQKITNQHRETTNQRYPKQETTYWFTSKSGPKTDIPAIQQTINGA